MSLLASGTFAALPDVPSAATTFYCFGADRIDITAYNADVKLEVMTGWGRWEDAQRIPVGLHKSFPGLTLQYPGGAGGFRLSNWTPGSVAGCDFEAAGVSP